MQKIYMPTFHTFENENIFTGSFGDLRFKITPDVDIPKGAKEIVYENSSMKAEFWHGPLCYEKSEIEGEKVFPLSAAGREEMIAWLTAQI